MLKKKPIIFATGCSFTDPEFFSRHEHLPDEKRGGWPVWPELIKNKIEKETGISYELINLARSGGSNDWVYNTCLDTISKYDQRVKIILIGGTEWMRSHIIPPQKNYQPFAKLASWHYNPKWKWLIPQRQATMEMWAQWATTFGIQEVIYHNLRHMYTLLQICNDKKIKFIWNQLLNPLPAYNNFKSEILEYGIPEEELRIRKRAFEKQFFVDTILKSPYAKLLVKNKKQFYGFPWAQGSYWENYIWERKSPLFEAMVLPPTIIDNKKVGDIHPNAFGHKQIALQIWERYGNYLVKN